MKKVFTYIFSFILMIIITFMTLVQIFDCTLLEQEYIEKQIKDNNYYSGLYNKIEENFEQYILQSGLDKQVIQNIITEDSIQKDIENMINGIYNDEKYTISTDIVKKNLENNIEEYVKENNINLNSSEKKSINEFVSLIVNTYENSITNSNLFKNFSNIIYKVEKLVDVAQIIGYVSIVVLIFIILIINRNIRDSLKNLSVALLSSGLLILIPVIMLQFKNLHRIYILSEQLSNLIYSVIKNISTIFLITSIVYIVLGIIITFITEYRKK